MKYISKEATKIMDILTGDMHSLGAHRKIDNNNPDSGLMAVSVERINEVSHGPIYSVAHYYEQNGDLMADPDVEFLKVTHEGINYYYPLTYKQDGLGIYWQHVIFEQQDGKTIYKYNRKGQADLSAFCNSWMRNIKHQQNIRTKEVKPHEQRSSQAVP